MSSALHVTDDGAAATHLEKSGEEPQIEVSRHTRRHLEIHTTDDGGAVMFDWA